MIILTISFIEIQWLPSLGWMRSAHGQSHEWCDRHPRRWRIRSILDDYGRRNHVGRVEGIPHCVIGYVIVLLLFVCVFNCDIFPRK